MGVDGAVVLPDLVSQRQHQGTGTGRWVVDRHILDLLLHQDTGNDRCNDVRRVVFSVLSEVFVVVLDQILKNLGKKVVVLIIHLGETELDQFVDNGAAKRRLFGPFDDILGDRIKELDLFLPAGLDRKNIQVIIGNIHQSIVEQLMKRIEGAIRLFHGIIVLVVKQIGDIMCLLQPGRVTTQHGQQHLILVIWHSL